MRNPGNLDRVRICTILIVNNLRMLIVWSIQAEVFDVRTVSYRGWLLHPGELRVPHDGAQAWLRSAILLDR